MQTTKLFLTTAALATSAAAATTTQAPFLVMGDWGGSPMWPFTTGPEKSTASGMGKLASDSSSTFALALGDNFYDSGVKNVHDSRFQHTFENVFDAKSLQAPNFSFKVIAGNHDHRGNVTAQVEYSNMNDRWDFPSLYYTFTEGDVQFVMLDTVVLSGNSDLEDGTELDGKDLPGPASTEDAQSQLEWLEQTLSASRSKYLVVTGHYPVHSICEHGPTPQLIEDVQPMLEKYNVSAWMNGHDHCKCCL
jgi:tartrate-resistant acid phosphatase type 5